MNFFQGQNLTFILCFFIGFILKKLKLLQKDDAHILLRFVLNVCIPPLMILAIYRATLALDLLLVALCAMLVMVIIYFISSAIGKKLKMEPQTFGSFLVATMIMNTAFALPYFKIIGSEELARASLFDIGNTIMIFTFAYYQAIKYGTSATKEKIQLKKFLTLPPLYAILFALLIKMSQLQLSNTVISFLELLGNPTGILMMVALGLACEPKLKHLGKALIAVVLRMGVGLITGYLLTLIFRLHGTAQIVVIICSSLPAGFNTLILADRENMDRDFAATVVSISTFIALFTIPLLINFFY